MSTLIPDLERCTTSSMLIPSNINFHIPMAALESQLRTKMPPFNLIALILKRQIWNLEQNPFKAV